MEDRYGLVPAAIRRDYERSEAVDQMMAPLRRIESALKAKDPRLELVRAKPHAPPPLIGGYWHVHRKNDGAPDTYMPITTASGGFREPDFGIFDDLDKRDLWRHGIPEYKPPKETKPDYTEEIASDVRAAWRVAGEAGMNKKAWGRG